MVVRVGKRFFSLHLIVGHQSKNHISPYLHKQKFFDFKELFILLETNTFFW